MRDKKIDYIKGILIFLVVFGHSIQYGSGTSFFSGEYYFEDALFKLIYSFHMPCFGILSGLLYYRYVRNRSIVKKLQKIWKLLTPMLCFAVVNVIMLLYERTISATPASILKNYVWLVSYNWWFIWSIIICYVFWISLETLRANRAISVILYVGVQLLFVMIPNKANSPLYGFIFLYFAIGYYWTDLRQLIEKKLNNVQRMIIKCGILILWIICVICFQREDYIYTSLLSINSENENQLRIDVFRWITGILGSFAFLEIFNRYISRLPECILKILSFMGKNTIYIYILQGYFCVRLLNLISLEWVPMHYFYNFLEAILITLICCVLIFGTKKLKQILEMSQRRKR